MNRAFQATALLGLSACGPSPVGTWQGVLEFTGDDGTAYINEMFVSSAGTADLTLYVLFEDPEDPGTMLIGVSDFSGSWDVSGGVALFDLECGWANCDFNPTMECESEDPGMVCDMTPDYYADDTAVLQWIEL